MEFALHSGELASETTQIMWGALSIAKSIFAAKNTKCASTGIGTCLTASFDLD